MKLCTLATWAFRLQQNDAVIKRWRLCQVTPSQKNMRLLRFVVKRRWCCCNLFVVIALNVWFTTNEMYMKNKPIYIYMARTSNNKVIAAHYLYCYLMLQYETLHTCRLGFPIATLGLGLCTRGPKSIHQASFCQSTPVKLTGTKIERSMTFREWSWLLNV